MDYFILSANCSHVIQNVNIQRDPNGNLEIKARLMPNSEFDVNTTPKALDFTLGITNQGQSKAFDNMQKRSHPEKPHHQQTLERPHQHRRDIPSATECVPKRQCLQSDARKVTITDDHPKQ